ncbi:MAG: hypothetical protein ACKVOE_11025 [Rickettsiales bacterium]
MTINLSTGAPLPQALPGSSPPLPTPIKSEAPTPQAPASFPGAAQPTGAEFDKKRYDAVEAASQSLFKNSYAVSDTTFSIYKDGSGQYITRYINLRDGRVTYIPEPQLLQQTGSQSPLFEIKA